MSPELFWDLDNFATQFSQPFSQRLKRPALPTTRRRHRPRRYRHHHRPNRKGTMHISEVMTVIVLFHTLQLSQLQTLLSRPRTHPHAKRIPESRELQPICRTGTKRTGRSDRLPQRSKSRLLRHQLHRLNITLCLSQHADQQPQGHGRTRTTRQDFHRLVLRIRTPPDNQRQRRTARRVPHARQRRRSRACRQTDQKALGKTFRRSGIYLAIIV